MKIRFISLVSALLFSQSGVTQTSPMNSSPGQPPPPEGWTQEAPPNGGIHMPHKKKNHKLRMGPAASPTATPAVKTN